MEYFSEYGEDASLHGLLHRISWLSNINIDHYKNKQYIDIGCYHPINKSTTYMFYQRLGWSGVLIDPNPKINNLVSEHRPRDIFINKAALDVDGKTVKLLMFNDMSEANSISSEFSNTVSNISGDTIQNEVECTTISLNSIAELIDDPFLISIDAEGVDERILKAYSWSKRPVFFMIEDIDLNTMKKNKNIEKIMTDNRYQRITDLYMTSIYIDMISPEYKVLST